MASSIYLQCMLQNQRCVLAYMKIYQQRLVIQHFVSLFRAPEAFREWRASYDVSFTITGAGRGLSPL